MDLYNLRSMLAMGKTIYDIKLRVTYYARVSTDKDEQINSIRNQVEFYEEFIRQNPNWSFVSGYVDEGISGTSTKKRDSFKRMLEDAKVGKFDFIITKEISRFSRNTLDSIKYTQELLSHGVGVLFQSDNINTLMPDSELRLTIMSSVAQDEVRKISERVKFGFQRAIDKGVVLGSNRMWGYTKDNGKLVIEPEEAEMVRKIFSYYANDTLGLRAISLKLLEEGYINSNGNPLSFSTLKTMIRNPKYKGYYCGRKTTKFDYKLTDIRYFDKDEWLIYKDETGEIVPAIVSEELWDKANFILDRRSEKQRGENAVGYHTRYPYTAKIICTEHNLPYYRAEYKYKSGNKEVWQCKEYSVKGKAGCSSPIIYRNELDTVMKNCLDTLVENKEEIIHDMTEMYKELAQNSNIKNDILHVQNDINTNIKRKNKLLDLNVNGRLSDAEFEERNLEFNNEIDKLKEHLAQLTKEEAQSSEVRDTIETLRRIITEELEFTSGVSGGIVTNMVERIEVSNTDDKNCVEMKVYLKIGDRIERYNLQRKRGKETSISYIPHI